MSRSFRKAILKDSYKGRTALYWRRIRRVIKNKIRSYPWAIHNQTMDDERYEYDPSGEMSLIENMPEDIPDLEDTLPDPKSVVNNYDYSDYTFDYEYHEFKPHCPWAWKPGEIEEYLKKLRRK